MGQSKSSLPTKHLSFIGSLDFDTIHPLIETLDALKDDKTIKQIELTLTSTGGGFFSAFALYGYLKAYSKPVDIIATGSCQSSAILVLQAARRRLARPYTFFFIHQGHYHIPNRKSIKNIRVDVEDFKRQEEAVLEVLSNRAKVARKKLKALSTSEHGFREKEALEIGLIDAVVSH